MLGPQLPLGRSKRKDPGCHRFWGLPSSRWATHAHTAKRCIGSTQSCRKHRYWGWHSNTGYSPFIVFRVCIWCHLCILMIRHCRSIVIFSKSPLPHTCPWKDSNYSFFSPAIQVWIRDETCFFQVILNCSVLPCLLHLLNASKESIKKEACW